MPSEITIIYKQDVVPRLDIMTVLGPLKPRRHGNNFYMLCPLCGQNTAFMQAGRDRIQCNRSNNCSGMDVITYLNGGKEPDNKKWCDLVRNLAQQMGINIPEAAVTPEVLKTRHIAQQQQDVWAQVLQVCRRDLPTSPGEQYLTTQRGFTAGDFSETDFGYFNRKHVDLVATPEQQKELGIHAFEKDGQLIDEWDGRLIIPIRNRFGEVHAISGRDLTGTSKKKFYKSHGYKPELLPVEGLDVAARLQSIWLGESTIAIHSFRYRGLEQMTGIGGSNTMSAERFKRLREIGIHTVILMLDPDEAGAKGEVKTIKEWLAAGKNRPDLYVVDSKLWGQCDPDEYLRTYGPEATKAIVGKAVNAHEFLAVAWARELNPDGSSGWDAYIDRTAKHLASINDPREAQQAWEHFFRRGAQKQTKIDEDFYFDYVTQIKQQEAEAKAQDALRSVRDGLSNAIQAGEPATARPLVAGALHQLDTVLSKKALRTAQPVSQRLDDYEQRLIETASQETLGLASGTYPTLEKATLGRRGLTCVAGGPGTGKTTFLVNDGLDIITQNPDCCLLVVSLEMAEVDLLDRIYCRLLDVPYEALKLNSDAKMREMGRQLVTPLAERIMIIDTDVYPQITADIILRHAAGLKEETGCKHIYIIVDYFQIFPIPEDVLKQYRTTDERDEWKAKEFKRIRDAIAPDHCGVISEVNKASGLRATGLDSLRGSSRLAYVSDNVYLVNRLEETDLIERVDLAGQLFSLKARRRRYGKKPAKMKEDEREQKLDWLMDEMERVGLDFLDVEVAKVRGGKRSSFTLAHYHTKSDMRELTEHGPLLDTRPGARKKAPTKGESQIDRAS